MDLFARRLVQFSQSFLCINGLFFVPQKDGRLRMIVDARPASEMFRAPPSADYSSSSSFASLRVPEGQRLYMAQYAVRDFFIDFACHPR